MAIDGYAIWRQKLVIPMDPDILFYSFCIIHESWMEIIAITATT